MTILRSLKYLPLFGVFSLALSLAYVLKLAASNASISNGPVETVPDFIPIVYGEYVSDEDNQYSICNNRDDVRCGMFGEWMGPIEPYSMFAILFPLTSSTLIISHVYPRFGHRWSILPTLENTVTTATIIMYYIFLFHQGGVGLSELNRAKSRGKMKVDDFHALNSIKFGSDNIDIIAANRL